MASCPHCGFGVAAGAVACPLCRAAIQGDTRVAGRAGDVIAWEDPERRFPTNFLDTLRESLFAPGRFFARAPWEAPLARPILYYLILAIASAFFTLVWTAAGVEPTGLEDFEALQIRREAFIFLNFTLSPFIALLALAVSSLVLHLLALMLSPQRRPLGATARAFCYSAGPWLLTIVPWAGALAGGAWAVVLLVFGIREAHRTTTGRAVAIVLLPLALLAAFAAALFVLALVLMSRLDQLPGGRLPFP
ncbi:MAG: YIP1 family protein [Gemmatimonadota bacterium]